MFKFSECRGLCISNICRNITDLYRPITSKEYWWRIDGGGKFRKRETVVIRSDEGLTLETSVLKLLTVANSKTLTTSIIKKYYYLDHYRLYRLIFLTTLFLTLITSSQVCSHLKLSTIGSCAAIESFTCQCARLIVLKNLLLLVIA